MQTRNLITASLLTLVVALPAAAAGFSVSSNAIKAGQAIAAEHYWNNFGCSGGNVMPDLKWANTPVGTKSFAITFYDKDAPTGSGFWHWVAYDIPAETQQLAGSIHPLP